MLAINMDCRYPHHKSLRGESYLLYGAGIASWIHPLSECFQHVEAGFQYNIQVFSLVFDHIN